VIKATNIFHINKIR